jgi:hypothetical protein
VGDTLVAIILIPDGTHLSHFAGKTKECPVYMTIGNQSSKIRQMPSMDSIVMVTLVPIPIKNRNIDENRLDERWQTNGKVLNEVLQWVLLPFSVEHNSSAKSRDYKVLCADGNFQHCKPRLAASLAGWPEYRDLHHLAQHVCYWCECPKNAHDDYVPPDDQHPWRDYNLYQTRSDAISKAANAKLLRCYVHSEFNMFRHIPCIMSHLPKTNLLHTIQIGMLDHLHRWIVHFMKTHEPLVKYNAIWLSMPA